MHFQLIVAGGLVLVILEIRIARTHYSASDLTPLPHAARFGLTFSLAVTNPALILGFLAIFSSMSGLLALGESPYRPLAVLLGVAIGGALWWAALSFIVSQARARLRPAALDRINRWSGVLVAAFGFTLPLKMIY